MCPMIDVRHPQRILDPERNETPFLERTEAARKAAAKARSPRSWKELLKQTGAEWTEDKVPRLGAALAYYAIFSLAPLLVISLAILGLVYEGDAARDELNKQLQGLLGEVGAKGADELIDAAQKPKEGRMAMVLGIVALLFGASGVFGQLQDALNTIWEVEPKPGRGILGMLRDRFFSFTMVLGTGFLLLISLVLSAAVAALGSWASQRLPLPEAVLHAMNLGVSFLVFALLFALIFKYVPDVKIAWRDVWIGAVATAFLFTVGKFLIGLYLGHSSLASSYGAAGSLAVILVWVYYSAQILFLGAEFTQVYAKMYGSSVKPSENAQPVTEERRAEQGMAAESR